MRRSLLALLLIAVLVLALGLSACSGSKEPDESEPAVVESAHGSGRYLTSSARSSR